LAKETCFPTGDVKLQLFSLIRHLSGYSDETAISLAIRPGTMILCRLTGVPPITTSAIIYQIFSEMGIEGMSLYHYLHLVLITFLKTIQLYQSTILNY
jgi:hypothetical protein